MKYIISIHEGAHVDYIVGGSYIFQSEKYAILTESKEEATKRRVERSIDMTAQLKRCAVFITFYIQWPIVQLNGGLNHETLVKIRYRCNIYDQ